MNIIIYLKMSQLIIQYNVTDKILNPDELDYLSELMIQ